ncbi:MAG: FGGY-family carbohydrate kinase [Verrucomicrobiia bacterium]
MLLGLDLGTTNVKALVTDQTGRPLAEASCPVQLHYTGNGGVEQEIGEIERAVVTVIKEVVRGIDGSAIEAIGVSSQGGAIQVTDSQLRPVGRVISWLDERGQPFDEAVTAELGRDWFAQRLGRGRSGLGIGQVLRLHREHPGVLEKPNRLHFVGDLVVSHLCGTAAHDGTSCSLTMLYNPELRGYDPDLLERLQLEPDQLPPLIRASEPAGGLRSEIAQETGLRPGIPVSGAVHDQYASALGCGAVNAGTVMVGTGTAWVLLAVSDERAAPVTDEAFVCGHVVEGLWGQILSLVNGGSSFAWALKLIGLGQASAAAIEALLESTEPGSHGVTCWPFLASGAPTGCAPQTRGLLSGLQLWHRPADILRAVLEGLVYELNRHLIFLRAGNWPIERLVIGGAGASSRVTTQMLADVTGLPLAACGTGEASVLGAAILARKMLEREMPLAALATEMASTAR